MNNIDDKKKFIIKKIFNDAVKDSFKKLNPKFMIKNPIMFIVEIGFFITLFLTFVPTAFGDTGTNLRVYNGLVAVILFTTVLFANFAEAVAEGRGKAQAESLKKTKRDTMAKLLDKNGNVTVTNASEIKKGDIVLVENGDMIPNDGEIISGLAAVDESAIT